MTVIANQLAQQQPTILSSVLSSGAQKVTSLPTANNNGVPLSATSGDQTGSVSGAKALTEAVQPHIESALNRFLEGSTGKERIERSKIFNQNLDAAIEKFGAVLDKMGRAFTVQDVARIASGVAMVEGRTPLKDDAGNQLNGAASGKTVLLDTGLNSNPQLLRAVAQEELGESFFQQIFGSNSPGDFGAEVQGRIAGTATDKSVAAQRSEDDTVVVDGQVFEAEALPSPEEAKAAREAKEKAERDAQKLREAEARAQNESANKHHAAVDVVLARLKEGKGPDPDEALMLDGKEVVGMTDQSGSLVLYLQGGVLRRFTDAVRNRMQLHHRTSTVRYQPLQAANPEGYYDGEPVRRGNMARGIKLENGRFIRNPDPSRFTQYHPEEEELETPENERFMGSGRIDRHFSRGGVRYVQMENGDRFRHSMVRSSMSNGPMENLRDSTGTKYVDGVKVDQEFEQGGRTHYRLEDGRTVPKPSARLSTVAEAEEGTSVLEALATVAGIVGTTFI